MQDILLIIIVLGAFAFGFYIMKRVDKFLCENYKNTHINPEKTEPACVMLTDNMSEDDIIKEIREFKEKYGTVEIYLCNKDSSFDGSKQFIDE